MSHYSFMNQKSSCDDEIFDMQKWGDESKCIHCRLEKCEDFILYNVTFCHIVPVVKLSENIVNTADVFASIL